jgi:hypothetical protein
VTGIVIGKWVCAILLIASGVLQLFGVLALTPLTAAIVTLAYGVYILFDVLGEGK